MVPSVLSSLFVPGLPGQGMHLAADPLALCFLLLVLPQIVAVALADGARRPGFWAGALGVGLTVLAGDAFTLIFGFGLMGAAAWLAVLRADRDTGAVCAAVMLLAVGCLVVAVFLPVGGLAFCLILLGAGTAALVPGGTAMVSLYIVIRYGFVVMGAAAQPWWGVLLMGLGATGALAGAWRACLAADMKQVLAAAVLAQMGLVTVGLGLALRARALGDPALAALALQGAFLTKSALALYMPLLGLGATAVGRGAGTTALNGLGGLMRGMPWLGGLMIVGAAGLAAVPPGPGFAPVFLILHAVMAAAAGGGALARIGFTVLLAALGVSAALAAIATLRLIGIAFLGRPRTLNAAGATDASPRLLAAMGGLALLCLAPALVPGLVLAALAPVIKMLVPGAAPAPLAYAPMPLVALLLLCGGGAWALLRRLSPRRVRPVPDWAGGFGAPPAWLPFGDPLTQPSATGLTAPLRQLLVSAPAADVTGRLARAQRIVAWLGWRISPRQRLAALLGALVLALLGRGAAG